VIFHEVYTEIDRTEIDRFIASQELGRLVTVGDDGTPHIGLYPFVRADDVVELHLVREDEQVADLRARRACVFEVDEILGTIPSYWVHPQYGGAATAYHRTVILECRGEVIDDADELAAQQQRLLARYQPEGGHRPVAATDPVYHGRLAVLVGIRLTVVRCRAKFKLGQNRPEASRRAIITELRRRGRPNDARAADALEWTLGRRTELTGGR
jgi:predicted FMN-binding regulatory protein PaiB